MQAQQKKLNKEEAGEEAGEVNNEDGFLGSSWACLERKGAFFVALLASSFAMILAVESMLGVLEEE